MPQVRNRFIYITMGLTIALLVYSVSTTELFSVSRDSLGLAGSLPYSFWMGLALLGLLWFFGTKKNWVLATALILSIGYLFFAPAVIRDPVWLSNSYYPFGESTLINTSGHLVDRVGAPLNSYHDWPLFIYFSSVFTQLTGVSYTPLLKFFPLLLISAYALITFFILRIKVNVAQALLGTGVLVASFWFRQQYFGPPGFGYLFFLLGLLLLLKAFFSSNTKKPMFTVLFLLMFVATSFTHFLSAVMLLTFTFVLLITQVATRSDNIKNAVSMFLFSAGILLLYNILFTPEFFSYLTGQLSNLVSFQGGLAQESARIAGSAAQVFNYRSTLAMVGIDCIIPAAVFLMIFINKTSRRRFFTDKFSLLMLIALFFLGFFAVFFQYGPHEGYQRALLFALLPISYMCAILAAKKPKLLVVAIAFLLFLNIPAQYGADSYTLQTKTDLAGAQFVALNAPKNSVVLYDFSLLQRYFEPAKNVSFRVLDTLPFTSIPNASDVLEAASTCDYVIVSRTSDNYYYYFTQHTPIADTLNVSTIPLGYSRIYDSGDFVVLAANSSTT